MKIISKSSEETKRIGKELAEKIKGGDIVLLFGDLGAGKTTFVQGFAEGLGIRDRILSPTFVLQRLHDVAGDDIKTLNHIDLYRIENLTEIENFGLIELFEDKSSVTLIEWAERLKDFKPKKGWKIIFNHISENERELVLDKLL